MFLKCIEMTGFKSFPDKTQMQMNGSITGVVGPNGSGKSNVSDAVRWVLGEQSAKSLRGSVMQDVIFAGTQKRKPRAFCEVSLIFDNSDNRLGTEYSEIEVRRKLYRSGESEYYLNNTKCRLKDILTLFRDTGVGKEGYSIVGQGKIDEILSDKSQDRRRIFEEASGIMKYRVRKEEAERKLEKTRYNLLRVEDILGEQQTRIGPLKRQADNAKAYLELSDKLKDLEVNLFLHNYDKGKDRIAKLKQTKQGLEEERLQREHQLKEFGDLYLSEQENAKEIEAAGDQLAAKLSGALAEIERAEGEIKLCEERMQNIDKDTTRVQDEIQATDERAAAITRSEEANAVRLKELEEELESQQRIVAEASSALAELSSVFEDRVKIIETVQSEKVQTIEKMADVKSMMSALKEKQQNVLQRSQEVIARLEEISNEQKQYQSSLDEQKKALEVSQQKGTLIRDSFNEKVYTKNQITQQIADKQKELEKARTEYATCASSAKLLRDMKNSFEGYIESVKRLMIASKQDKDIGRRIIGTVADVISVPAKFETAIETVLGSALQNIVVRDEYDAKNIISFLRKNNMGRVTFLPLEALKQRVLTPQERDDIDEDGVLGVASELVACDSEADRAVQFLLGRTVIVDNNDTAIHIMRKCEYAFRVVTLDGDIFNPGGAITGGSIRKSRGGLVSRDRREEDLKNRAKNLNDNVITLEKAVEALKKQQSLLTGEIEEARKVLHNYEIENATGKEKLEVLSASIHDANESFENLIQEKQVLAQQQEEIEDEINGYTALQSDMQQSSETKSQDYRRMEDEYNQNAALIEEKKNQLHDAEIKIAELFRENTAIVNDNHRLGMERQDVDKAKRTKQKTLELNAQSSENLLELKTQLQELHQQKIEMLDELKKQQTDVMEKRGTLSKALTERDQKMLKVRDELSDIAEKSMRVDFSLEKVEAGIESAQNKLWETYQLTYANALPLKQEIDVSEAQSEADSIKRRIRYLGNVNPNAIEDYAELKERMDGLTTQKDDLITAEEDLHKLIASLLTEMRKTFRTSFDQINRHFNKAFKDLFNGGRAELVLEDDQDIMECGIEIIAEPPGKTMQKLSLMSGGEKALTAISLLFALLKINPSPVCILDEIDAALDEANVYKFSEYLKKFTENMQFIVITHRKPTMIMCDSLYGFAMEEKGVSKLLSVRLD